MTDQEILNAIDAEIEAVRVANTRIRLSGPGASEPALHQTIPQLYLKSLSIRGHTGYINGLRFARALIAKRMEGLS